MMSVSVETLWGRKGAAAEEKGSNDPVTFDTLLQMQMDIRVEIWQSVPALTGSGIDNDQWLGQWDVSVQAGKLIKWH